MYRRIAIVYVFIFATLLFCLSPALSQESSYNRNRGLGPITELPAHEPLDILHMQSQSIFGPLPAHMPESKTDTPEMIALGEKLYFEKQLSINQDISCNSCHLIDKKRGGTDYTQTSLGSKDEFGPRNAPTTLNAGFQISQFWDGRSPTLADQAGGPMMNPVEMAMPDKETVLARIKRIPEYTGLYSRAFPDADEPVTFENTCRAIAAFERTLITPARFDRYMQGDTAALTNEEKQGLAVFMEVGCNRCHNSPTVGGVMYQKIGVYQSFPDDADMGRYKVTKKEKDKQVFKVPILRNITLTPPYYHNGKVDTLAEAVDLMAFYQLDTTLSNDRIRVILQFLNALADKERTTAPAPQDTGESKWWNPKNWQDLGENENADQIRYGYDLITDTYKYLGDGATSAHMKYTGNSLSCTNCHQFSGTKQFGIPWVGVSQRYPRFRGRANKMADLKDRINGCMQRSMNGKPLPRDGQEIEAIVAYMNWLSDNAPEKVFGQSRGDIGFPDRKVDFEAGRRIYMTNCQSCHGANGEGYRSIGAGHKGSLAVPPLWGPESYNDGAGMGRVLTAAPFIRHNMPLGTPWMHPVLSDMEAYDVAGFINSKDRPQWPNKTADWPDRSKKRIDAPYPPYADPFTVEQHRFGPFKPIKDYYDQKGG